MKDGAAHANLDTPGFVLRYTLDGSDPDTAALDLRGARAARRRAAAEDCRFHHHWTAWPDRLPARPRRSLNSSSHAGSGWSRSTHSAALTVAGMLLVNDPRQLGRRSTRRWSMRAGMAGRRPICVFPLLPCFITPASRVISRWPRVVPAWPRCRACQQVLKRARDPVPARPDPELVSILRRRCHPFRSARQNCCICACPACCSESPSAIWPAGC